MPDKLSVPNPATGRTARAFAPVLAVALCLALAPSALAATMPLHLADTASGDLAGNPPGPPGTRTTDLGADPADLAPSAEAPAHDPTVPLAHVTAGGSPAMPSLAAFPARVGRDFVHLITRPLAFDTQDWTRLALGAGAVGVVALFDNRIHHSIEGSGGPGSTAFARTIRPIGTWGGVAAMGAALAVGGVFHDADLAETGMDGIEASVFTGVVIVPLLKKAVGRTRPNRGLGASAVDSFDGGQSFPSGEVALAFTNAAVVAQHTDSAVVRGIAWGLAGLVGWERMRLDAHWASDVVAGALIGSAVGSWVVKIHKPEETTSSTTVSVMPLGGPRTVGVTAAISW